MILVQDIGMSGYVPFEGLVSLSQFLLQGYSCTCNHRFYYLNTVGFRHADSPNVLRKVVSFAVVNRFSDSALFAIIRDIGLLSGYYRAGVVFPGNLNHMLRDNMHLEEYRNLTYPCFHLRYPSLSFVFTSAWAEYICLDPDVSYAYCPPISIQILGYKNPFPSYTCDELRNALS
jgi:hypothetical protein